MMTRILIIFLCLFCAGSGPALANGDVSRDTEIRIELEAKLANAYGSLWAAGDPKKFVDQFLTDDAIVTASDSPAVWAGDEQNVPLIAELMAGYPRIKATPVWTRAIGSNTAYQFVKFELLPADENEAPIAAKSLYIWVKTADGWRVAADHYSYSSMDQPTGVTE